MGFYRYTDKKMNGENLYEHEVHVSGFKTNPS